MNKRLIRGFFREDATGEGGEGGSAAATGDSEGEGTTTAQSNSDGSIASSEGSITSQAKAEDWRDKLDLSDDIKTSNVLKNVKNPYEDPTDLVNQLYHAQKKIGEQKGAMPAEDWSEDKVNEFYNELGKPKEHADYEFPDIAEEHKQFFDVDRIEAFKEKFHKHNLTKAQAKGIIDDFTADHISAMTAAGQQLENEIAQQVKDFQETEGDQYEMTMQFAAAAVREFGGDKALQRLQDLNVDRDPVLNKMFSEMGKALSESSISGEGDGGFVTGKAAAQQEKEKLMSDPDFKRVWLSKKREDRSEHQAAVKKISALNEIIYGDS